METLSDDAYNQVLKKLLGIPVLEERDLALPIAKKWLLAYSTGELKMTDKQYESLRKCVKPSASDC